MDSQDKGCGQRNDNPQQYSISDQPPGQCGVTPTGEGQPALVPPPPPPPPPKE